MMVRDINFKTFVFIKLGLKFGIFESLQQIGSIFKIEKVHTYRKIDSVLDYS